MVDNSVIMWMEVVQTDVRLDSSEKSVMKVGKKLYLKQDLHNTHNKSIKIEISLSAQLFYTNKSFIIDKCTSEVTIVIKIIALIYIFYLFYYD